jgi:hypothetical protein
MLFLGLQPLPEISFVFVPSSASKHETGDRERDGFDLPKCYNRWTMLSRRLLAAFIAGVTLAAVNFAPGREAKARSCLDDTVKSKSDDGSILVMMSGAVYEVLPGDNIDSALWLPPEDVLICEAPIAYQGRTVMTYEIINTDEGEKVGAQRLR